MVSRRPGFDDKTLVWRAEASTPVIFQYQSCFMFLTWYLACNGEKKRKKEVKIPPCIWPRSSDVYISSCVLFSRYLFCRLNNSVFLAQEFVFSWGVCVFVRDSLLTCHVVETNPITAVPCRKQALACGAHITAGFLPAQRQLPFLVSCHNLSPVLLPLGHFSAFWAWCYNLVNANYHNKGCSCMLIRTFFF